MDFICKVMCIALLPVSCFADIANSSLDPDYARSSLDIGKYNNHLSASPPFCDVAGEYKGTYIGGGRKGTWSAVINPYTGRVGGNVMPESGGLMTGQGQVKHQKNGQQAYATLGFAAGASFKGSVKVPQPVTLTAHTGKIIPKATFSGSWHQAGASGTFDGSRTSYPDISCTGYLKANRLNTRYPSLNNQL